MELESYWVSHPLRNTLYTQFYRRHEHRRECGGGTPTKGVCVGGEVYILTHVEPSTSPSFQAMIKFGSTENREQMLEECKDKILTLAKSTYGHHVIKKLVTVLGAKKAHVFLRLFKGNMVSMLRHPKGAPVINDLYHECSSQQQDNIISEFYGPEYALFEASVPIAAPK